MFALICINIIPNVAMVRSPSIALYLFSVFIIPPVTYILFKITSILNLDCIIKFEPVIKGEVRIEAISNN